MRLASTLLIAPAVLALAVVAVPASAAPAPTLEYTQYDVPGADFTRLTGVTNRGVLAGSYGDEDGVHGFVDDGRGIVTVDIPGSTETTVTSINDAGTVTGSYRIGDTEHGFVRDRRGTVTVLDAPDATGGVSRATVATDINDGGTVVGYTSVTDVDGNTVFHGFVWRHGRFTSYDAPGSSTSGAPMAGTQVFGVDNAGTMVGAATYIDPDDPDFPDTHPNRGFLASRHGVEFIVDPEVPVNFCGSTEPNSLTQRGLIAGNSRNGCAPVFRAWLLDDGVYTPLEFPGATSTFVYGLDERGVAVGSWTVGINPENGAPLGPEHGFVVTTR